MDQNREKMNSIKEQASQLTSDIFVGYRKRIIELSTSNKHVLFKKPSKPEIGKWLRTFRLDNIALTSFEIAKKYPVFIDSEYMSMQHTPENQYWVTRKLLAFLTDKIEYLMLFMIPSYSLIIKNFWLLKAEKQVAFNLLLE